MLPCVSKGRGGNSSLHFFQIPFLQTHKAITEKPFLIHYARLHIGSTTSLYSLCDIDKPYLSSRELGILKNRRFPHCRGTENFKLPIATPNVCVGLSGVDARTATSNVVYVLFRQALGWIMGVCCMINTCTTQYDNASTTLD